MMRGSILLAACAVALTAVPLAAQPTPRRLAPTPGVRLSAEYLIGRWSDREDCQQAIEFRGDGSFHNPDGTRGTWRLEGDLLTLTGTRAVTIRMVPRNRNETVVVQANGTLGYSQRCPGPARP